MSKSIEVVVLHFGSEASSQAAPLLLVRRGGDSCPTKAAAIQSVARFFYKKWAKDNPPPKPKRCCDATRARSSKSEFCDKCSRSLSDPLFDHESYTDWLLQQPSQTAGEWGDTGEWCPWNAFALISYYWKSGGGGLEVGSGAERLLTWALDPEAKWIPEAYKATIRELQERELDGRGDLDVAGLIEENVKTFDELIEQRLGASAR